MLKHYTKDFVETSADVLYSSCFVQHLSIFASFAWLIYEYCITLDKEIEFFWCRRPNGGTLLFFLSRYLPFLVRSLGISGLVVTNERVVCPLEYIPCAVFGGVRAWVLGRRSWSLTAFVTMLGLVPVGLEYKYKSTPLLAVPSDLFLSRGLKKKVVIASRVCLIASDAIVLVVTWFATYNIRIIRLTSRWEYTSFLETLLRDGTIHFCALLILNVLDLVFSLDTIKDPNLNSSHYVMAFLGPAATILINRFLIHIQEVNKHMIQGFDPSEHVNMRSNDSSLELRFVKSCPHDRPTIVITDTSSPHDNDLVQLMDGTLSETTEEAHI